MLFNAKSDVSGHLLKVHKGELMNADFLWVGSMRIDAGDFIAASATLTFKEDRTYRLLFALGTTDPFKCAVGYSAELAPIDPCRGMLDLRGYLKPFDRDTDDVFEVTTAFATNADGTSRLDVVIVAVPDGRAFAGQQTRSMFAV